MAALDTLRPYIRINAPGCPDLLIDDALFRASREFYMTTEAWVYPRVYELADYIGASADYMQLYETNAGSPVRMEDRIVRIRKVTYDGKLLTHKSLEQILAIDSKVFDSAYLTDIDLDDDPDYFYYSGYKSGGVEAISFYPPPTEIVTDAVPAGKKVVVLASWYPDSVASDIMTGDGTRSTEGYLKFKDQIIAGALAQLLIMPEKQWSNPGQAQVHRQIFDAAIDDTRSRAASDYGQLSRCTTYGGI